MATVPTPNEVAIATNLVRSTTVTMFERTSEAIAARASLEMAMRNLTDAQVAVTGAQNVLAELYRRSAEAITERLAQPWPSNATAPAAEELNSAIIDTAAGRARGITLPAAPTAEVEG